MRWEGGAKGEKGCDAVIVWYHIYWDEIPRCFWRLGNGELQHTYVDSERLTVGLQMKLVPTNALRHRPADVALRADQVLIPHHEL